MEQEFETSLGYTARICISKKASFRGGLFLSAFLLTAVEAFLSPWTLLQATHTLSKVTSPAEFTGGGRMGVGVGEDGWKSLIEVLPTVALCG